MLSPVGFVSILKYFYRDGEVLVGHDAVNQQNKNSANTIYDAKRFIGKKFTQSQLEKEAARYQFKVSMIDAFLIVLC